MATQGPNSPGTMADVDTVGTKAWSSPDNAKTSDNIYTTITQASGDNYSHYLKATNFGFSIPTNATITGISVEVEVKVATATKFIYVEPSNMTPGHMQKAGVDAGDAINFENGTWPITDTYKPTVPCTTDLWGTTWTPADINDSGFGYKFNCHIVGAETGYVDHIYIAVYYIPVSAKTLASVGVG